MWLKNLEHKLRFKYSLFFDMFLEELFFVMESVDVAKLEEAKEILSSAEAMEFRLYRDAKVSSKFYDLKKRSKTVN